MMIIEGSKLSVVIGFLSVMGRVLGIGMGNRKYRNLFWYRNRRILVEFPILETILWNSYVCNLSYNLRILGLEYE